MKRLAGKPFALLGINSDEDREELKTVLKEENLNWRNWWDGGGREGPIATRCCGIADAFMSSRNHCFAVDALVMVSRVLKLLDAMIISVSAVLSRSRTCEICWPSTFAM